MAFDQSVRQLMQNSGYDSDKIGYDPNSGYVQYRGVNFLKPQINQNGTTFTDQPSFDQANKSFKQNFGFLESPENNMDMQTRMAYYAGNPTAAQNELSRADKVAGYMQSIGNQDAANQANQYKQSVMYAIGQQPNQNPQDQQINNLISSVMQRVQNPQAYDVYNSPEYQANKTYSDLLAKQAINNGLEAFGASGMGRSSDAQRFAQNTQNEADQRLMAQVVPQLIQQHNAIQQQQTGNLMGLISPLMQQRQNQFNNQMAVAGLTGNYNGQQTLAGQQADLQKQEALANLTGKYNGQQTFAAQQAAQQNAIARAQALGVVDNPQDAALLGVPVGTTTREMQALMNNMQYKNAMLGLRADANSIAAMRAGNTQSLNSAREKYYNAEADKASQTPTTKQTAADYKTNPSFAEDLGYIQNNPQTALDLIQKNAQKFTAQYGYDGYKALYNEAKNAQNPASASGQ